MTNDVGAAGRRGTFALPGWQVPDLLEAEVARRTVAIGVLFCAVAAALFASL